MSPKSGEQEVDVLSMPCPAGVSTETAFLGCRLSCRCACTARSQRMSPVLFKANDERRGVALRGQEDVLAAVGRETTCPSGSSHFHASVEGPMVGKPPALGPRRYR